MSRLHERLARLKRLVNASTGNSCGCHRCNGAPLLLYDDEPDNTAPYGPMGYCEACGFMPRITEIAVAETGIGKLFADLTFSPDPLLRKLEKGLLRVALGKKDVEDAYRLAVRLLTPADAPETSSEINAHVDPQQTPRTT